MGETFITSHHNKIFNLLKTSTQHLLGLEVAKHLTQRV